jgi:hypothetical protein
MGVSAHGTSAAGPFLETGAMKDVLTDDGQEAGGFIHTF